MQYTLHLFLGDDLSPVAEAVKEHVAHHCVCEDTQCPHIATWCVNGNERITRLVMPGSSKTTLNNDIEGRAYFYNLHPKLVIADPSGNVSTDLYLCIYAQLYIDRHLAEIEEIIDWAISSERKYVIDVYGITNDLAHLFCVSEKERHNLVYKADQMKKEVSTACKSLSEKIRTGNLRHLLLIQNCNLIGQGLELDKNTLIRIFGEYARLTTTNFIDLYPINGINRPEVLAFGISAFWFRLDYFHDYLYSRTLVSIFERELINQHACTSPAKLLKRAKDYVNKHSELSALGDAGNDIQGILTDSTLSLPEKRAILSILLGEEDELLDDSILCNELPTIDDCLDEALKCFINVNNQMIDDGNPGVLSGPKRNGHVFCPIKDLKRIRKDLSLSKSYIRKSEKRLAEIEANINLTHRRGKKITDAGFVYDGTTYKVLREVSEQPLAETYQPKSNVLPAVDMRSRFSPIRVQGDLSSCSAFSISSIFEYLINSNTKTTDAQLSPRFLYYNVCPKNDDGTPRDEGSSLYSIINSLTNEGICSESLCPYDEDFLSRPTAGAYIDAKNNLVTKALNVEISHQALTSAISEGYPVAISLKIFDSFANGHKGFIFRPTDTELNSTDYGYHAMVICGYSEKEKVYIVRNSWGTSFGDNGYCYIPFSYIEDPELCAHACIVTETTCSEPTIDPQNKSEFDTKDSDTEYAVLRILIEEERVRLKRLTETYEKLYKDYRVLLIELSKKSKRDALMGYCLSKAIAISKSTQPVPDKVSSNKWVYTAVCALVSIISFIIGIISDDDTAKSASIIVSGISLLCMLGLIVFWKNRQNADIEENTTTQPPTVTTTSPSQLDILRAAGDKIETFTSIREDLTDKRKRFVTHIPNLENWYETEKQKLSTLSEGQRKPFYSLCEKDLIKEWLSEFCILNDFHLANLIATIEPTLAAFRSFKLNLDKSLRGKVDSIASDFSMSEYLLGIKNYPFLPKPPKIEEIFRTIKNMSIPLVETNAGIPSGKKRNLILCDVVSDNNAKWEQLLKEVYTAPMPQIVVDNSNEKVTFIQFQDLKLDETMFG